MGGILWCEGASAEAANFEHAAMCGAPRFSHHPFRGRTGDSQNADWAAGSRAEKEKARANATAANAVKLRARITAARSKATSPKEDWGDKSEAHHIVFSTREAPPQGTFAKESRDLLDSVCFDVNDADNGVLVTKEVHQNSGLHTKDAAELALKEALAVKKDAARAREVLREIRRQILEGIFMPNYVPKKGSK